MSVYIAASLQLLSSAKFLSWELAREGIEVVSTWHTGRPTIAEEKTMSVDDQRRLATRCLDEIYDADALVLLYNDGDRKGSYLETGYAMGRGIPVVAVRTGAFPLPTLLLTHHSVVHAEVELEQLGPQGVAAYLRAVTP